MIVSRIEYRFKKLIKERAERLIARYSLIDEIDR